jgi:Na+/melibiose symporter-like transporter
MKAAYVVAPAIGGLCTLWLIHYYDLSEDKSYAIKAELAQRRAKAVPPA